MAPAYIKIPAKDAGAGQRLATASPASGHMATTTLKVEGMT